MQTHQTCHTTGTANTLAKLHLSTQLTRKHINSLEKGQITIRQKHQNHVRTLPTPTICTNIGSAITKTWQSNTHQNNSTATPRHALLRVPTNLHRGRKEPTIRKTGAAIYDPSGPLEEGYRCTDNISVYSTKMIALIVALTNTFTMRNISEQ
jgi:hypothetical protein